MMLNRMKFLQGFDEQKGNKCEKKPGEADIIKRSQEKKEDQIRCIYEGCGMFFRTKAGFAIHQKRTQRKTDEAPTFTCNEWGKQFRQEVHGTTIKKFAQEAEWTERKKSHVCKKLLIGSNLARHMRIVHSKKTEEETSNEVTARVYKANNVACDECRKTISAPNLARHQKSKACIELPI